MTVHSRTDTAGHRAGICTSVHQTRCSPLSEEPAKANKTHIIMQRLERNLPLFLPGEHGQPAVPWSSSLACSGTERFRSFFTVRMITKQAVLNQTERNKMLIPTSGRASFSSCTTGLLMARSSFPLCWISDASAKWLSNTTANTTTATVLRGLFQNFPASLGNFGYKLNSLQRLEDNSFT